MPVISKQDQVEIARHLSELLAGRVGIEVWTRQDSPIVLPDRDPCIHCDSVLAMARELTSLNSLLTFTRYDLDRHAERAAAEGIERAPTTVLRAQGAKLHLVGYFTGLLFPVFVDCLVMAGAGVTALRPESKAALTAVTAPVTLELLLAPYEPLSAYMLRLGCALAIEQHAIRLVAIEMTEFPALASQRALTEVPTVVINGRRFTGVFSEAELVEQVRRVVAGDVEPVIRESTASSPYLNIEQMQALAAQANESPQPGTPPPPSTPGGLYVPGR